MVWLSGMHKQYAKPRHSNNTIVVRHTCQATEGFPQRLSLGRYS
jgi:hypothetical protein